MSTGDLHNATIQAANAMGFPGSGDPRRQKSTAELADEAAAWDDQADAESVDAQDDDADEAEAQDDVPQTPAAFVAAAQGWESELIKAGWESVDAFLIQCATDARWFLAEAAAQGWNPEARPGARDLPPHIAMQVVAAGVPGAKIVPDRLHRPLNRWG